MDKWLVNANASLNECNGVGDVHETQRQLELVNVSIFFFINKIKMIYM